MKQSKLANALLSAIVLACFGQSVNVVAQLPHFRAVTEPISRPQTSLVGRKARDKLTYGLIRQ